MVKATGLRSVGAIRVGSIPTPCISELSYDISEIKNFNLLLASIYNILVLVWVHKMCNNIVHEFKLILRAVIDDSIILNNYRDEVRCILVPEPNIATSARVGHVVQGKNISLKVHLVSEHHGFRLLQVLEK